MSEYRPWDLSKPPEPEEDPAEPEPLPAKPKEATPEDLEKTKVQSAPGLGERIAPTKDGGRRLAAWTTLSAGGLLLFGALFMIMGTNITIGLLENEGGYYDADEVRTVRNIAAPILMLFSLPALTAGFGLVYRQGWAKPLGQVVAGLQILTIVGLVHGILTFAGLASWRDA